MSERDTVSSLDEIAMYFEILASDQIACIRFQVTKKAKAECQLKADIWNEAACILKNTDIVQK